MFKKIYITITTFVLSLGLAVSLFIYYFSDSEHLKKSSFEQQRPNDGYYTSYYDDGVIKSEEHYKNGLKHGIWKNYYPDGQLKDVMKFKNDMLVGEKKHYSITGQLIFTEDYEKGILVDMKILDDSLYKYESNIINHGKLVYTIDCMPCHEAFDKFSVDTLDFLVMQRDTSDTKVMVLDSLHKPYLTQITTLPDSTLVEDNCIFVYNKEYDLKAVIEYIKKHKQKMNVKPVKMRKLKIKSKTS